MINLNKETVKSDSWDGKTRTLFYHNCDICDKEYLAPKKAHSHYCSKQCSFIGKQKRNTVVCALCGKTFETTPSKHKNSKSGLRFCSRVCKDTAQQIGGIKEIQPSHYNTGIHNYRDKALRRSIVCEVCGISEWNGKPLILDVHHIDGNRENNLETNLIVVCPNCHRIYEQEKWSKSYGALV